MTSLITRNKSILSGSAAIRGTRISVTVLKGMHKAGDSTELLMKLYDLSREQVEAAVNFGKRSNLPPTP